MYQEFVKVVMRDEVASEASELRQNQPTSTVIETAKNH